ncbi:hypothetical protein D1007_61877 [Hordeum vulgare]|nr:hypothetical protein D1007_61877 [Hordeum vulgare]
MAQYRHIEVFDMNWLQPVHITEKMRPESDHYNLFVLDGGGRMGYLRCRSGTDLVQHGDHVSRNLHRMKSPVKDIGFFRVSVVLSAISKDGSKLAFVDNKFKTVWIAANQGLRLMYEAREPASIFSPLSNQNRDKDILYVCITTSTYFNARKSMEIYAINNASDDAVQRQVQRLTYWSRPKDSRGRYPVGAALEAPKRGGSSKAPACGGVRSSLLPFDAEQFDDDSAMDREGKASFFSWFYLRVSFGPIISGVFLV